MAKELAKKATELVSSISSASTGGLSTRPSRVPYDQVPVESREHTICADEVLAERASRAGKLTGGISSGGLSTRPSRKAYGDIKSPFGEPEKPSASPLKTMGEDTEVTQTQPYGPEFMINNRENSQLCVTFLGAIIRWITLRHHTLHVLGSFAYEMQTSNIRVSPANSSLLLNWA